MKYEDRWYTSPINLPQGRHGDISVTHSIYKKGTTLPVVGIRQAIMNGKAPIEAQLSEDLRVHVLKSEEGGVWMTDMPEELNQIAEVLHTIEPAGNILVGGLGLGIMAKCCAQRMYADRVVVIENNPNVIALCKEEHSYEVVEADIKEYLRSTSDRFDFYLLDTWQATSEATWWEEVVPLRRIIRQRHGKTPVIHCWAEDIMLGQIVRSLITNEPHWHYEGLPVPMNKVAALRFVRDVGMPTWEKRYGAAVDENARRENEAHERWQQKIQKMKERIQKENTEQKMKACAT